MLSKIKNRFHKPTFDMSLYKQKMSLLKNTKSIEKNGVLVVLFSYSLIFSAFEKVTHFQTASYDNISIHQEMR